MSLPQKHIYTIEDIYALPEGQRAELIDGGFYMMAPPSTTHQRIVFSLGWMIGDHIKKNGGSCEVFPAPFAVFLEDTDTTYVEPDLSVICDTDKIDDKGCHGAPDWIIEVVSPSSKKLDYYTKLSKYQETGVKEYWIVDPLKEVVIVYNLSEMDIPYIYHFSDKIKVHIYEDMEIDFSQVNF